MVVGRTVGTNAHLFLSESCLKGRKQLLDDVYMRALLWGAKEKKWVGTFRLAADILHHNKKTGMRLLGGGTFVESKKSGKYSLSCGAEFEWPREMKTCGRPLPKTSRTLRFWLEPGKTFIVCSWVTKEPEWHDTCFALMERENTALSNTALSLMERENRALSEWNWNGIDDTDIFEVK